ncbi:MAG: response regulator [Proteobacteria bacterium]|nr:response regulator [Desulfobulbaceae bacterium]MBU4152602.1 response regulator [Pseudomonadota bacterium]MDP2106136.1 response regulator [Desulfobulbaceae bacterium]
MKILIVEDNPHNLKLFRVIVEAMGHQCLTAEDGEAGIAVARQTIPDLILMDIQMPRLDGISAVLRLRQEDATKAIPVIALTSYAMKGDKERFMKAGFNNYISKPINKNYFVEMIQLYEPTGA